MIGRGVEIEGQYTARVPRQRVYGERRAGSSPARHYRAVCVQDDRSAYRSIACENAAGVDREVGACAHGAVHIESAAVDGDRAREIVGGAERQSPAAGLGEASGA